MKSTSKPSPKPTAKKQTAKPTKPKPDAAPKQTAATKPQAPASALAAALRRFSQLEARGAVSWAPYFWPERVHASDPDDGRPRQQAPADGAAVEWGWGYASEPCLTCGRYDYGCGHGGQL